MSVGRRVSLPVAYFLLVVLFLRATPALAQGQGSHTIWQNDLSSNDLTAALLRLGEGGGGGGAGFGGDLTPFENMVRDYLTKENPNIDPKRFEPLIKQFSNDPQMMKQLKEMARKSATDPGRVGRPSREDLAKLFKTDDKGNPALKTPPELKIPPDPKIQPDPKIDPKVDPMNPPKVNPTDPVNPNPTQPPQDRANPFGDPEENTDPRAKSLGALAAFWERNLGSLDDTPEVKKALFDLLGDENGFDFDLKDDQGNSIWDILKNGGEGTAFEGFLDGGGAEGWNFPKLEWPDFGWGKGGGSGSGSSSSGSSWWNRSSSSSPRSSSGGGGFGGGFGGSWLPLVVLGLIILCVLVWVLMKNLRNAEPAVAFAGDGLGPWPIDPRNINTREDVVKAFEYLSVLICGPSAKNWTHGTIAEALTDLATTHGNEAVMLARLYELARYAPLDEPLTRAEVIEARQLVCDLAGVSY